MKSVILLFLALIVAVFLGLVASQENTAVIVQYGSWSLQTSLWVTLLFIIALFILLHLLLRLLQLFYFWPRRLRRWKQRRKRRAVAQSTRVGLTYLIEANWQSAEHTLAKAAWLSPVPLVNYWGAAYAAARQKALDRRDYYLQRINQRSLLSRVNWQLLTTQLQLLNGEWEEAGVNLAHLYQQYPKHPQLLKYLAKVYIHQENWSGLQPLIAPLRQQQVLPEAQLQALSIQAARALLGQAGEKCRTDDLEAIWRRVPVAEQPDLWVDYVTQWIHCQQDQQAMVLIERFLKQQWDVRLLPLYEKLTTQDIHQQLAQAELWLRKHPQSSELLTCLGVLSMRCQLWGKARDYLSAALALKPEPKLHYTLAQVYEALNDQQAAGTHYHQGLILAVESNPLMSQPSKPVHFDLKSYYANT